MSERVKKLEKLILKYKQSYYLGKQEISDESYDILEEELRQLDPESFALNLVGTQVASKNQKKVKHNEKMLSLEKTYEEKDLIKWQGNEEIIGTYKIDGVSCSLIFEFGRLVLAKTRGDGTYGEDITSKILWMDSIPKNIQSQEILEVRGEMYCPQDQFVKLADEMERRKLERPSNQRNIVAGLMGRKDNVDLAKYIQFLAFDILSDQQKILLEENKFEILKKMGFELPEWKKIKSGDECLVFLEDVKEFIEKGDFPIDGAVFSYNRIALHRELGATSHHPKYKIAFKFKGDFKITSIERIEWGVSRNGILTPVAIVEPVELSGAQISRVTLHNWGVVRDNHLKVGDKIEITRSGEVIPKFLNVVESIEGQEHAPEICPSCGEKVKEEDIRLYCPNEACPGRNKESILNYVQKIGIENLSDKRIEELLEKKIISDIPDLYDLTEEKLQLLDNVKDKMAKKLIESIKQSRSIELITFLSALGFSGGAYNKCEKIVRAGFNSLEKIKKMTVDDLMTVDSFAEKSSGDFIASLNEKWSIIEKLLAKNIQIKVYEWQGSGSGVLEGKKICITGELSEKRNVIEDKIRLAGGIISSSVSKNTDYLLTNEVDSNSSKFLKAKKLGIIIVSEDELNKILKNE